MSRWVKRWGRGGEGNYPKMAYCMSRCGESCSMTEKEVPPLLGSEWRAMDSRPRLWCFSSGCTSSGTLCLSNSLCLSSGGKERPPVMSATWATKFLSTLQRTDQNSAQNIGSNRDTFLLLVQFPLLVIGRLGAAPCDVCYLGYKVLVHPVQEWHISVSNWNAK